MKNINIEDIDMNKLREYIVSCYKNLAVKLPIAMNDAMYYEQKASDEEVLQKAIELNEDLTKYMKQKAL